MEIRDARVLLTGATGGLGQAIARALALRGARLLLTGRRAELLEPLAAELGADALVADLADRAGVEQVAASAADADVLVSNAGLPASGHLDGYTVEQLDRALDVNLRAPVMLAKLLSPGMVARGRGQLVFISSLAGKAATGNAALYSATKFGLRGFAISLRDDLRGTGVGATVVMPGFIRDAGMFADTGARLPRTVGTRRPQDVAAAVVRAIERNPAELEVAPVTLRLGAAVAALAPELAALVSRRMGSADIGLEMAARQRSKR